MSSDLERELQQARRQLETISEEFDEFVSIISHDLRAPLRHIEGFAKIIHENNANSFDEKSEEYMQLIIAASSRAQLILGALTRYARLKNKPVELIAVDMNEILDFVMDELKTEYDGFTLTCEVDPLPGVYGDTQSLRIILKELINNALTYHKEGVAPIINIKASVSGKVATYSITDNGMGFIGSKLDQYFKPLKRGVKDKDFPGLGMGLSFAKTLVEAQGGKIWIEPSCEDDTVVAFSLDAVV